MASSSSSSSGGIGFCGLLCILFIGLRLTHFIDWSWLWVLSPLWLPLGIFLAFTIFGLFVALMAAIFRN